MRKAICLAFTSLSGYLAHTHSGSSHDHHALPEADHSKKRKDPTATPKYWHKLVETIHQDCKNSDNRYSAYAPPPGPRPTSLHTPRVDVRITDQIGIGTYLATIVRPASAGTQAIVHYQTDCALSHKLIHEYTALSILHQEGVSVAPLFLSPPRDLPSTPLGCPKSIRYLVRQVAGETVRSYLNKASVPFLVALEFASYLFRQVAVMHKSRIIHNNIMMDAIQLIERDSLSGGVLLDLFSEARFHADGPPKSRIHKDLAATYQVVLAVSPQWRSMAADSLWPPESLFRVQYAVRVYVMAEIRTIKKGLAKGHVDTIIDAITDIQKLMGYKK